MAKQSMTNEHPEPGTCYYILCQLGDNASELTSNGEVCIYATKRLAQQAAAHMRLLMEGGARVTYTVKAAR
jgi:hypothetical protein